MRILITGSDGFIGRNVGDAFEAYTSPDGDHDDVFRGSKNPALADEQHPILDLSDEAAVREAIEHTRPDVIVNCAGVVAAQNPDDFKNNSRFTTNILKAASGRDVRRVIVCGSAGVYGQVEADELPVKESTPLRADSPYALSKKEEEEVALSLGDELGVPVTVARIFNPIGPGMGPRFLVTGVLGQLAAISRGESDEVVVGGLDALRDYVDVRDVARALVAIAHGDPKERIYNVGSGESTSNGDLVTLILKACGVEAPVRDTATAPAVLVACQADISRLTQEFGWRPTVSLQDSVKAVADEANRN